MPGTATFPACWACAQEKGTRQGGQARPRAARAAPGTFPPPSFATEPDAIGVAKREPLALVFWRGTSDTKGHPPGRTRARGCDPRPWQGCPTAEKKLPTGNNGNPDVSGSLKATGPTA